MHVTPYVRTLLEPSIRKATLTILQNYGDDADDEPASG